jgi:hypothetical protein
MGFSRKEGGVPPQGLLIVSQLDDKRHLEGVLQPLGEEEGHQVAQVQCF